MGDGFPLATKNGFSWPPWIHLVKVNVAQHLKLPKKLHVSLPAVYHKGGYLLEANLISSPPQCGRVMLHP